jgi:type VI secretion system protein ImpL
VVVISQGIVDRKTRVIRARLERLDAVAQALLNERGEFSQFIRQTTEDLRAADTSLVGGPGPLPTERVVPTVTVMRAPVDGRWRTEVWEAYHRMSGRYPFLPEAAEEVSLAEFAEFFRPKTGTIWAFYERSLSSLLSRSGARFTARPSVSKSRFRSDFLRCLEGAQSITEALFHGDTMAPSVSFAVELQPVGADISEITLQVDGQELVYRNDPARWRPMSWPGQKMPPGAAIVLRGPSFKDEIRRHGEFAFIRLLAKGGIEPVAPGSSDLRAAWKINEGEHRVMIQLRPSAPHPFRRGFFSSFKCPTTPSTGGVEPARP